MLNVIRHYRSTIATLLVFLPLILSGCVTVKPYYFNNSDKVYTDKARAGACASVDFDCVVMSQGKFRQITTANPLENGAGK